ncbi:MAG: DUF1919 domain-containing protein [Lachnospiraceae bacterium]|nr:DUF1919 domain-containing protein [Lachnospiraceae bacterium]
MNEITEKLKRKGRYFFYRKRNKNRDFTLLSQNCLGGVIYSILDLPFASPTINLFIEDENFVKLAENPVRYLNIPAEPGEERSAGSDNSAISYPTIRVDDIEICCLHYKNCSEAVEAWERRRRRVNFSNMYVLGNSWNLHENEEYIRRVASCPCPAAVLTLREMNIPGCIKLPGDFWKPDERGIVRPNVTDEKPGSHKHYFEDFFDFVSWLNGGKPNK